MYSLVGPGVDKGKLIQQMTVSQPVEAIYHEFRPTESLDIDRSVPPLERIRKRGFLRVGYQPESLPYAFVNDDGQLVGFSVDLAHWLAKSLEVSLEFIPMRLDELEEMTKGGVVDLVVSAPVFEEFLDDLRFSEPYIHITAAILCEDHLRHRFKSIDEVRQIKDLRLGFGIQQPLSKVEEYLPNAELVPLESYYDFLEGKTTNVMALLSSAESGSAWSLLYPSFSVVVPQPDPIQVPVAFAVYPGDSELILFLNDWIKLVKDDGTLTKLYNYWILGKNIIEKKPRWSVVRNVFGLGESERRKVD